MFVNLVFNIHTPCHSPNLGFLDQPGIYRDLIYLMTRIWRSPAQIGSIGRRQMAHKVRPLESFDPPARPLQFLLEERRVEGGGEKGVGAMWRERIMRIRRGGFERVWNLRKRFVSPHRFQSQLGIARF